MKRLQLLFVSLLVSALLVAGNVTTEQAAQSAQAFLNSRSMKSSQLRMVERKMVSRRAGSETEAYYVFNVGKDNGFVIVSGDDRTPAILGYSEHGAFDSESIPENMRAWLEEYAKQIAWLQNHSDVPVYKAPTQTRVAVSPLLKTRWDQSAPFNNLCPMDGSERSLTGCVATAMAQVLNYYKYPATTKAAVPAYTTETKHIQVPAVAITPLDWDNMSDTYGAGETAAQENAVATLMQVCGAAVQMDYTSKLSSAYSNQVADILKTYFDYDAATQYLPRSNYRSAEWDEMIYNELANRRPVYYCGSSTGGGHAFVVDGYDGTGMYHVNWGWSGNSDSYFLLSVLDSNNSSGSGASSSSDGYSFLQEAVIGVQPNTGVPFTEEIVMTSGNIFTEQTEVTKHNNSFPLSFTFTAVNNCQETHTFDIGVGLFDNAGTLRTAIPLGSYELKSHYGFFSQNVTVEFPAPADGVYKIAMISRQTGSSTWKLNKNGDVYFLKATVSGNKMAVESFGINLATTLSVDGNFEVGGKMIATIDITNNGVFFNDVLYLQVDGVVVGGRHFDINNGEQQQLTMDFVCENAGSQEVAIGYKVSKSGGESQFIPLATTTITVQSAKSHQLSFSNGSVVNAVKKKINDNKALLRFTVKNNDAYGYDDVLRIYSMKAGSNNLHYMQNMVHVDVELPANGSQVVTAEVPLTMDGSYWFLVVYKTNGEFLDLSSSNRYGDLRGYTATIPASGIDAVDASTMQPLTIYTLSGQRLTPQQWEHAPKGVYIVNGKKVRK